MLVSASEIWRIYWEGENKVLDDLLLYFKKIQYLKQGHFKKYIYMYVTKI